MIEPVFIKAVYDNVISTDRGTTIGNDNVKIHTIEHILSAVYALGIDNLLIEIDNVEPPILDGSSVIFYNDIIKSGIVEQNSEKSILKFLNQFIILMKIQISH